MFKAKYIYLRKFNVMLSFVEGPISQICNCSLHCRDFRQLSVQSTIVAILVKHEQCATRAQRKAGADATQRLE